MKRKQPAPKTTSSKKDRAAIAVKTGWELDSESDDDNATKKHAPPALLSALTRRVVDGVVRRTTNLNGDVFVDLKIYNTRDIVNVEPKDRWERALVSLKYQGEADSPELAHLKKVVKLCKGKFKNEGIFFADKKK